MSFDLFQALGSISKRKLDWYDTLSPEDQKAASPFVLGRWLTGTADQAQLVRLNTFVNPYMFSLGQDKALLFKLLAAACTGKTGRYYWLKAPGTKSIPKLKLEVLKQFYEASTKEAQSYVELTDGDTVIEMALELGWDDEQIKQLKKELKGS